MADGGDMRIWRWVFGKCGEPRVESVPEPLQCKPAPVPPMVPMRTRECRNCAWLFVVDRSWRCNRPEVIANHLPWLARSTLPQTQEARADGSLCGIAGKWWEGRGSHPPQWRKEDAA